MNAPILSEEGLARASRNRTIFNRALIVIMDEYGMTREDVLNWLDKDDDPAWRPKTEVHPFTD